jgi:RecB family exonuclease
VSPESVEPDPPRIVVARGVRAAEAHLLAELEGLHAAARADWALLAAPVRVVVPSRSLRDHLAGQLVRRLGGGVAGVQIQTLRATAFGILEHAAEGPRGGETLVPVLVRRFAASEPALAEPLGRFDDGYTAALASVNDLLDAGLVESNVDGVRECIDDPAVRASDAARARAHALANVALRVQTELAKAGLEPRAGFFRRAREQLETSAACLPTRALFFHGWADVTGVQLDLIEALVRCFGGQVVLDHPVDPADPAGEGPGPRWTERLRVRLGAAETSLPPSDARPTLRSVEAPGSHAEVRAVARRIRALLDDGALPEAIGIVLREPALYRNALRTQLERLAIPFSGSLTSLGPSGRRIRALLVLLERRDGCPADRWLDAQARTRRLRSADLRLAFHGIGVGRLRDVAALDVERTLDGDSSYALPVRRGLMGSPTSEETGGASESEPAEREPDAEATRLRRRRVSRDALAGAVAAASGVQVRLEALAAAGALGAQLSVLRKLLVSDLGWRPEMPAGKLVFEALAMLERELGPDTPLGFEDLLELLRRSLGTLGQESLGGQGAGVAVLSAIEARGRTFTHCFVLALNRDVFPRLAREDALLPDVLRRALEAVLPDVPVKQRAEEEERYLFAGICGAAPDVTLSWLGVDDDGKERAVSPLVEALRTNGLREAPAPPVLAEAEAPRPSFEHAVRAGSVSRLAPALGLALGSEAVAAARVAALAALDVGGWSEPLGPFFGFVGAAGPGDPRLGTLSVTRLEGLARCAWQAFLERVLGLEPPPDALAELPDATPLLIGNVVHAVLEALVEEAGGAVGVALAEVEGREPVRVGWPSDAALDDRIRRAAERAAREEGIVLRGFAAHLARRARPLLDCVRALDWADGVGPAVLGAELEGAIELGPSGRRLRFRADRADRTAGGIELVDYKTGAPVHASRKPDTQRKHLLAQIAQGRRLQAPAYARASHAGRYLFAKEELDEAAARVTVGEEDAEADEAFEAAAVDLLTAFERGAFPPRLLAENRASKGPGCDRCDVADACLSGETGHAQHLAAWLTRHEESPAGLPPGAAAALALLLRLEKRP